MSHLMSHSCGFVVGVYDVQRGAVWLRFCQTDHADSNWVSGEGWPMQPWTHTCCEAMPHGLCGTGQPFIDGEQEGCRDFLGSDLSKNIQEHADIVTIVSHIWVS